MQLLGRLGGLRLNKQKHSPHSKGGEGAQAPRQRGWGAWEGVVWCPGEEGS